jgi:rare lipoprotein A
MPIYRGVKRLILPLLLLVATIASADPEMDGIASWYGGKFHGRLTSNGEVFDTNEMTAAHKTLPFGTLVRVTNLDNGMTTIVRINDRGPFVEGRIIDLSRAGADAVGMVGIGVARVKLDIIGFETDKTLYAIQVGAYGLEQNAEKARTALESAGFVVTIEKTTLGIARVSVRGIAVPDLPGMRKKVEGLGFAQYLVKKEKTEPPQISSGSPQAGPVVSQP